MGASIPQLRSIRRSTDVEEELLPSGGRIRIANEVLELEPNARASLAMASRKDESSISSNQTNKPFFDRSTPQPGGRAKSSMPLTKSTEGANGAWYKYTRARALTFSLSVISTVDLTMLFQDLAEASGKVAELP